ncbi:MAG: NRDE family protein [Flavobacteriales bacterium]|nr:NRDE family protein [Flavobacteriales bacterium]MCB9191956.1 NRDE family protein [Flavobacteriales bacterium]
MCLCLFAIDQHDEFPFVLLANRDEFRRRPAEKARFWEEHPNVLAGKDLQGNGTWLGISKGGRIAFLTNYRHPRYFNRQGPTRGTLVSEFLTSEQDALGYLNSIEKPEEFNGFNLVVGTYDQLFYYSNVENEPRPITVGYHGLSNAFLNTSWPKVDEGKKQLQEAIESDQLDSSVLFGILKDEHRPDPNRLPDTGVGQELEKLLSPKFINSKEYGTVCSTVVKVHRNGTVYFEERSFDSDGNETDSVKFQF